MPDVIKSMLHHVDMMQQAFDALVVAGHRRVENGSPNGGICPFHVTRQIEEKVEGFHTIADC
jgi:hypothetical protein